MEDNNDSKIDELEVEDNKDTSNEEQIEEIKKSNNIGLIIISIIYSFIAIIIIWYYANTLIEFLLDGYSFVSVRMLLLVIFVLLVPFIMLGVYFGRKDNSLKIYIIIYEVIILLLVVLFWLSWPSIKSSIDDSCCDNIATYRNEW